MLAGSAGLTLAFALDALIPGADGVRAQGAGRLNAYVDIAPDGMVTITTPAPEMGQGVNTTLPLIIAEELDADWAKVSVRQAPVADVYNHPMFKTQYAVGSLTTRGYWMPLRIAGAQARRVLMDAAAARWSVPVSELKTEPGMVVHAASGRKLGYGEIAAFAISPEVLPDIKPDDLKPASQFRLIGQNIPRIDVAAKSTGRQLYAMDVQLPGMLYATVERAQVREAGPVSFNRDEIVQQPGVVAVVALEEAVGIVGHSVEAVLAARERLKVQWGEAKGDRVRSADDLQDYLAHVRDADRKGVVVRETGKADAAMAVAATIISADYTSDYICPAQLEPLNTVASVRPEGVEIWSGTQWPTRARAEAARVAGVTPEKVTVHTMQMGGGYGRRVFVEYVADAVSLSKAVSRPVKLIMSREADLVSSRFRPLAAQRIDVGLDATGKIVGWRHRIAAEPVTPLLYGQARMDEQKGNDFLVVAGADMPFYDVPAHVTDHIYEERGVRVGAWRGIAAGYTNFAIEAMIDDLARQAGKDPLAYRLALLKEPRARAVVERVAQLADWQRKREGRALGIAFAKLGLPPAGFSMAGTVAEISLDRASGRIKVHNLWCVADVGLAVQPRNIEAQLEGALIFSLGAALKERITIRDGRVEQSNFHDYELVRMSDVPDIKVEILSTGSVPLPVGELAIGGTAPAMANAFLALTGRRLRDLPMLPERVLAALS